MKARVLQGINDLIERGVSDDEMFVATSISLTAMRYNVVMDHISARSNPFTDDVDNGDRLIIDLGMSGGMDALFYSLHGYTVVGIEANPSMIDSVRETIPRREFPRFTGNHTTIQHHEENS